MFKVGCKIHHRVNTLADLSNTQTENGIEVDVRYHENDLILAHDPFHHHEASRVLLIELARAYKNRGPLILNLKTEGIERSCVEIMNQCGITNWFFLDMSPPYLVKFAQMAQRGSLPGLTPENLAIRFSEREPIEQALSFAGQVGWVWVDCFTHLPLTRANYQTLKRNFKICLVSPELQGHGVELIGDFKNQLIDSPVDAVCTKRVDLW